MNDPRPARPIAERASWRTVLAPPSERIALALERMFDADEFAAVRRGFVPEAMEDKWFVFFEAPWLYFHRSWSGEAIYGLCIEQREAGAAVIESWVSRDAKVYTETDVAYDRAIANFLIDALLLDRRVPFPVPADVPANAPAGVFQHAVVGRAHPEQRFDARPSLITRLLRRWRGE